MTLSDELAKIKTIFIDTAPIIYFIEAHPRFGAFAKAVVAGFQSHGLTAYSSVVTLTEVLAKPVENGDESLARRFADFLKHGKNLHLLEITEEIAEAAGVLRGRHSFLKTMDAIQIAAAIDIGADAFITNDVKLKQVSGIRVITFTDYPVP